MSATTVANPTTTFFCDAFSDYKIQHTGSNKEPATPNPNPASSDTPVRKTGGWIDDRHRVPAYRPLNRHLDLSQRPLGSNPIETVFLIFMFGGVALHAAVAQSWGLTGGRLFPRLLCDAKGGEW